MGDEPAAWMDEFRPELRWLAARELGASRRLEQSSFYDQEEEERITTAELAAHGFDPDQFWSRFKTAAFKHGYKRPRVGPGQALGNRAIVSELLADIRRDRCSHRRPEAVFSAAGRARSVRLVIETVRFLG